MAWIELHQELRRHPKIIRLASLMKIRAAEATGYVVNLWMWAAGYAQDGNLSKFSKEEIAAACDAEIPEVEKFLIETGWIDRKGTRKTVHDWQKYGIKFLSSNKERVRKYREKKQLEEEDEMLGNITVMSTNLTNQPNQPTDRTNQEIYALITDGWNEFAETHGLATVLKLTPSRRAGVRLRVQDPAFDFMGVLKRIEQSPFLRGQNQRGWKVDFDFVFCSPQNFLKILEGKYSNGTAHTGETKRGTDQGSRAGFTTGKGDLEDTHDLIETLRRDSELRSTRKSGV